MTADLVEFLRAREAEREQGAFAAGLPHWQMDQFGVEIDSHGPAPAPAPKRGVNPAPQAQGRVVHSGAGYDGGGLDSREVGHHIARHDPAWVLADVEAKRQIIDEHALLDLPPEPDDDWPLVCRTCEDQSRHDAARWPCKTLRLLALPYAGHPQFREEWAPDASSG